MQLKTNGLIFIIGLCIGAFLFSKLATKQQAVAVKQEQSCEAVVLKTTDKNGLVTEKLTFKAVQSQQVKPIAKKLYGLAFKHQYDFKSKRAAYEFSVSRSLQDNLDILISYNTEQVAGVGFVVRF